MDDLNEALDELLEALKNMRTVMTDVNEALEDALKSLADTED